MLWTWVHPIACDPGQCSFLAEEKVHGHPVITHNRDHTVELVEWQETGGAVCSPQDIPSSACHEEAGEQGQDTDNSFSAEAGREMVAITTLVYVFPPFPDFSIIFPLKFPGCCQMPKDGRAPLRCV